LPTPPNASAEGCAKVDPDELDAYFADGLDGDVEDDEDHEEFIPGPDAEDGVMLSTLAFGQYRLTIVMQGCGRKRSLVESHIAEKAHVVKCWGNLFSILYEMESDEEEPCKFCTVTPTMNTLLIGSYRISLSCNP
jgi:hypothetical protein